MALSRKKWSKQVKIRDNHTCQKCGLTKDKAAIEAHHIVKRPGESRLKDGVTLCKWCHLMADMGKSAYKKWLKTDDFYSEMINNINENIPSELEDFMNKVTHDEIKIFLGLVSKFEKELKIKRSLAGKKASKRIKLKNKGNNDVKENRPGKAESRP
jgi:ribosomal protein L37AE/L43A